MSEKDTEIEDLPLADLDTDLEDLDMGTDLGDADLPDLEASDDLLDPFVGDSLEGDPLNGSGEEHALDDLPASDSDSGALSHDELTGALDDIEPDHLEDDMGDQEVGLDDTPAVMAEEVPLDEDPDELEPITLTEQELDNILGTGEDVLVDLDDSPEPEPEPDLDEVEAIEPVAGEAAASEDFDADLESASAMDELGLDDVTSGETLTPLGDSDFDAAEVDMGDDLGDEPVIMDDLPDEISDDLTDLPADDVPSAAGEEEDEEPVALSEAELDNILGDVDMSEPMELAGDELPADDLGGEVGASDASMSSAESEDDEDITLSDDELSNVLLDTEDMADSAPVPEAGGALDDFPGDELLDESLSLDEAADDLAGEPGEEGAPSILDGDDEDDEPVTLSMEELGNIVSDVDTEDAEDAVGTAPEGGDLDLDTHDDLPMADLDEPPLDLDEEPLDLADEASGSILDDDEDEGPVALSEDELSNILEDVDEEQAEDIAAPAADGLDEKNIIVLDEYEELGEAPAVEEPAVEEPEAEIEPLEPAAAAVSDAPDRSELVASTAAAENVDPGEVKKMISYLDRLFDQLPEDTIKEFSKSEYFDLYKKIMGDLGLLK